MGPPAWRSPQGLGQASGEGQEEQEATGTKQDQKSSTAAAEGVTVAGRQAKEELKRLAESRIEEDKLTQKSALQLHETCANAGEGPNPASSRREKVLVAIQNKDGVCKSFRQLKDEKFEKLFLKYAEWIGVPSQQLVFIFDGQKILEHQTPKDFDIEDEDIIEVNMKK